MKTSGDSMKIKQVQQVLLNSYSKDLCYEKVRNQWTEENKELGMCAITALIVNDYFKWRLMGCKKLIFDKKEQFDKCEDWEKFGHLIIFDNDWKVISIDFYNDKLVKTPQSEYFKLKGDNV